MRTNAVVAQKLQWLDVGRMVSLVVGRGQQDQDFDVNDFANHIRTFKGEPGSLLTVPRNMSIAALNAERTGS